MPSPLNMRSPLYDGIELPNSVGDGHRGLWYDRFFNGYADDWLSADTDKKDKVKKDQEKKDQIKKNWIKTVTKGKAGDQGAVEQASQRLFHLCSSLQGQSRIYSCDWHFATGLGNPHPVENGFLWHPTLGTPYIPGAAVKGLLRAWMECWHGFETPEDKKQKLLSWFGSEDKDPKLCTSDSQAGALIFFDALPVTPVELKADVMTPHMGKWYEKGDDITSMSDQSDRIPADWHDPVPVHFLVANKPSFLFSIAPRRATDQLEVDEAMKALEDAIKWLGAGAKTAVGYGLMQRDDDKEKTLQTRLKARVEKERQDQEEQLLREQRRIQLSKMSPLERKIAECIEVRPDKNQSETSFIFTSLKNGHWKDEEKEDVTQWLKNKMQENKEWRPQSQAKKPEKDTNHQRTLQVMRWLDMSGN